MRVLISFLLILLDFFVTRLTNVIDYTNNQFFKWKCNACDNHYIRIALYDINHDRIIWIYDYDSIWGLVLFWFRTKPKLIPYDQYSMINPGGFIVVGSYIKNGKQHYGFWPASQSSVLISSDKFIYCVLENAYDLTREFDMMKDCILNNKELLTKHIVNMVSLFFDKGFCMHENEQLKIVMDDTFEELTFKANDVLFIHHERSCGPRDILE